MNSKLPTEKKTAVKSDVSCLLIPLSDRKAIKVPTHDLQHDVHT